MIAFILYLCGDSNMVKGGVFDMVGTRGWFMEEEGVGVDTNSSKLAMYHGDSRNKQVPWL